MRKEYKIEVLLTPHEHDNKYQPYFWCLFCSYEDSTDWCNEGAGWAKTYKEAWEEAISFYERYKI